MIFQDNKTVDEATVNKCQKNRIRKIMFLTPEIMDPGKDHNANIIRWKIG